jgi:gliding motility-associated-like protein
MLADTINVTFNPLPIVNLGNDSIICPGQFIALSSKVTNGAYSYLWQDNSTSPVYNISKPGTYFLNVTANGCSNSDTVNISSGYCEIILSIPNLFTPNNDNKDDFFIPIKSKGIKSMHTFIYNRWGEKLFSSDDLQIEWDGHSASDGIYYWYIDYSTIDGRMLNQKGWIEILR